MEINIKINPKKDKIKIKDIEVLKKELLEITSEYVDQDCEIEVLSS